MIVKGKRYQPDMREKWEGARGERKCKGDLHASTRVAMKPHYTCLGQIGSRNTRANEANRRREREYELRELIQDWEDSKDIILIAQNF